MLRLLAVWAVGLVVAKKEEVPHFKWGQTKDLLFLSVMIRELDESSVSLVAPHEGALEVQASSTSGQAFKLSLPLREDIKMDSLKWEVAKRPDKWGIAILITMSKTNAHRWDLLVENPKKFKGLMDKDWTREDQTLEPEDEKDYLGDHSGYLKEVTEKNFNKSRAKSSIMVVNVRYPWCSQCNSQDDVFAKVAKGAKQKAKKDARWKKLGFFVLDAREHRNMARWLGARCDNSCEYRIFSDTDVEPTIVQAKWEATQLSDELAKFLDPAVHILKTQEEIQTLKEAATVVSGSFSAETSPRYTLFKKVAGLLRGELTFAATFGEDRDVQVWPVNQSSSMTFDGSWDDNGTVLINWIRPRAVPLLQAWEWKLTERYEKLGVPIAKIWLDDSGSADGSFTKVVRYAVKRVAKAFIGRIAFVEMKKSSDSYSLREFGMDAPEQYPAFGIASNASFSAIKYAFEVAPDMAPSAQVFYKDGDTAIEKLTAFCEQVLAGTWPEAHESGPVQTDWQKGVHKQLVWKTYGEMEKPERPLLVQVYSKFRQDNEKKLKEAENLAKLLEPQAEVFSIATYETSDNYVAEAFKREKYSSDTDWLWIPKAGIAHSVKLTKPKKDAPIKAVLQFAKKQSELDVDVDELMKEFEKLMVDNPPITTTTPPPPPMGDMGGMGGMDGMDGMGGMDELGGLGGMPDLSSLLGKSPEL